MVSHEFNRFSEYYRGRAEIEQPSDSRGDRKDGGREKRSRKAEAGFTRLFINLGKTDHFFPNELISLLNNNTRGRIELGDRKSTRLNSSHANISYAVFC